MRYASAFLLFTTQLLEIQGRKPFRATLKNGAAHGRRAAMKLITWEELRSYLKRPIRSMVFVAYHEQNADRKQEGVFLRAVSDLIALGDIMPGRLDEKWSDSPVPQNVRTRLLEMMPR